jgi:cell division protein FtsB
MAREAEANSGHAIARLADSGEDAMRNLAALPLRMLAGALGIFEALLRTAADAVSEGDQIDERVVDLERRLDSLEEQATGRREGSSAAGAARKRTSTGVDTAAEQRGA